MKIRHLLTIGLALLGLGAQISSPTCGEETSAAAKVLKGKAEEKAMGGLADDLSPDSPLNTRMETVNDLKGKLQTRLGLSESLTESLKALI